MAEDAEAVLSNVLSLIGSLRNEEIGRHLDGHKVPPTRLLDSWQEEAGVAAELELLNLSDLALMDLEHLRELRKLCGRGQQCLASLYLVSKEENKDVARRLDLVQEIEIFNSDVAEQVMLISASMVSSDAASIRASNDLLSALTQLLAITHRLDALRKIRAEEAGLLQSQAGTPNVIQRRPLLNKKLAKMLPSGLRKQRERSAGDDSALPDLPRPPERPDSQPESEAAADPAAQELDRDQPSRPASEEAAGAPPSGDIERQQGKKRSGLLWKAWGWKRKQEQTADTGSPLIQAGGATPNDGTAALNDLPSTDDRALGHEIADEGAAAAAEAAGAEPEADEWEDFLRDDWPGSRAIFSRLQGVPYHPTLLSHLAESLLRSLSGKDLGRPLLAAEVDAAAAALPIVLFLLHLDTAEAVPSPHLRLRQLLKCIKALRRLPVVPLFMELPLDVLGILQTVPMLVAQAELHGKEWQIPAASELQGRELAAADKLYDLPAAAIAARHVHDALFEGLTLLTVGLEERRPPEVAGSTLLQTAALEIGLAGVSCLHLWKQQLLRFAAWKYSKHSSWSANEAEPVVRQLSQQEKEAMLEMMNLTHGLGSVLSRAAVWLQPLMHRAMAAHINHFAKLTIPAWQSLNLPKMVQQRLDELKIVLRGDGSEDLTLTRVPSRSRRLTSMLKGSFGTKILRSETSQRAAAESEIALPLDDVLRSATATLRAALDGLLPPIQQTPVGAVQLPSVGAAPPSALQMFQLKQALDEISRADQRGSQGPFGTRSLPTSVTKELTALSLMLRQWEGCIDLTWAIYEGTDLGGLVLHESIADVSADDSLAVTLAAAGLTSIAGGPAESCLVPLLVFNEAAEAARSKLRAAHLVPALTGHASACLNVLIAEIARKALESHQAKAAAGRLSQIWGSSPRGVAQDCFEGLLKLHSLNLLGQQVDVGGQLSDRIGRMLEDRAQLLITRFEDTNITVLVELDAFAAILRDTHFLLSQTACLERWPLLWNSIDSNLACEHYNSRIATRTAKELVASLLPTFVFCSTTQRFAAGPKSAAVQGFELPLEDWVRGDAGSRRAFGSWAAAHATCFGRPHLEAFSRLCGPAGVAFLLQCIEDRIIQLLLTQISPGVTEARDRLTKILPQVAGMSLSTTKSGCQLYQTVLNKALGGELQREVMLRNLSELGNAFALLSMLDEVVAAERDSATLLIAPLLDSESSRRNRASQQEDGEPDATGPLQQAFDRLSTAKYPTIAHSVHAEQSGMSLLSMALEAAWRDSEPSSLLPGSIQKIQTAIRPLSMSWSQPAAKAHHVMSAALFELCLSRPQREMQTSTPRTPKGRALPLCPAEWDARGESPALGALFLVELLGQSAEFRLSDFSLRLLETAAFESAGELGPEASAFVSRAEKLDNLSKSVIANLRVALRGKEPPGVVIKSETKPFRVSADAPPFAIPAFGIGSETATQVEEGEISQRRVEVANPTSEPSGFLDPLLPLTRISTREFSPQDLEVLGFDCETSVESPFKAHAETSWAEEVPSCVGVEGFPPCVGVEGFPPSAGAQQWGEGYVQALEDMTAASEVFSDELHRGHHAVLTHQRMASTNPPAWPTMDVSISPTDSLVWNRPLHSSLSFWHSLPPGADQPEIRVSACGEDPLDDNLHPQRPHNDPFYLPPGATHWPQQGLEETLRNSAAAQTLGWSLRGGIASGYPEPGESFQEGEIRPAGDVSARDVAEPLEAADAGVTAGLLSGEASTDSAIEGGRESPPREPREDSEAARTAVAATKEAEIGDMADWDDGAASAESAVASRRESPPQEPAEVEMLQSELANTIEAAAEPAAGATHKAALPAAVVKAQAVTTALENDMEEAKGVEKSVLKAEKVEPVEVPLANLGETDPEVTSSPAPERAVRGSRRRVSRRVSAALHALAASSPPGRRNTDDKEQAVTSSRKKLSEHAVSAAHKKLPEASAGEPLAAQPAEKAKIGVAEETGQVEALKISASPERLGKIEPSPFSAAPAAPAEEKGKGTEDFGTQDAEGEEEKEDTSGHSAAPETLGTQAGVQAEVVAKGEEGKEDASSHSPAPEASGTQACVQAEVVVVFEPVQPVLDALEAGAEDSSQALPRLEETNKEGSKGREEASSAHLDPTRSLAASQQEEQGRQPAFETQLVEAVAAESEALQAEEPQPASLIETIESCEASQEIRPQGESGALSLVVAAEQHLEAAESSSPPPVAAETVQKLRTSAEQPSVELSSGLEPSHEEHKGSGVVREAVLPAGESVGQTAGIVVNAGAEIEGSGVEAVTAPPLDRRKEFESKPEAELGDLQAAEASELVEGHITEQSEAEGSKTIPEAETLTSAVVGEATALGTSDIDSRNFRTDSALADSQERDRQAVASAGLEPDQPGGQTVSESQPAQARPKSPKKKKKGSQGRKSPSRAAGKDRGGLKKLNPKAPSEFLQADGAVKAIVGASGGSSCKPRDASTSGESYTSAASHPESGRSSETGLTNPAAAELAEHSRGEGGDTSAEVMVDAADKACSVAVDTPAVQTQSTPSKLQTTLGSPRTVAVAADDCDGADTANLDSSRASSADDPLTRATAQASVPSDSRKSGLKSGGAASMNTDPFGQVGRAQRRERQSSSKDSIELDNERDRAGEDPKLEASSREVISLAVRTGAEYKKERSSSASPKRASSPQRSSGGTAPQTPFGWAAELGEGLFGRLRARRSGDAATEGGGKSGGGFSLDSLF